jgi:hypothetical protein
MERNGYYQYQVFYVRETAKERGYVYEIYDLDSDPELIRESNEWFDSEAQAGFAAIGHISLLENGEG